MIINNDTNIYVGDTGIVKVYQGNETIYKKNTGITSLGISDGQYIETNIVPDATTKVEMKIKLTPRINPSPPNNTSNERWVQMPFGQRSSWQYNEFDFWVDYGGNYNVSSGTGSCIYGMGSLNNPNALLTYPAWGKDCIITLEWGKFSLEYDGEKHEYLQPISGGLNSSANTLWLFNMHCPGDPKYFWVNGDWYYTKIWKNNELVRDFVPALDDNDVPCLYDKINKQLYYNQGSGQFIYG